MIKRELFRKFFHIVFLGVIPSSMYISMRFTQVMLIVFGIIYYGLEELRLRNKSVPIFSLISKFALREKEKTSIAFAPITLALGIILVLELYHTKAMYIAIIAATIGDSIATIMGQAFPKRRIFWNKKKSLVGMGANFLSVFLIGLLFLDYKQAFMTAIVSAVVESLDLEHVDNLMIPLSVGAVLYFI